MNMNFEEIARRTLDGHRAAEPLAKTYAILYGVVEANDWEGACHATTAVAFVLLREQGIEAQPCLGEVTLGNAVWDHSWIEVDGKVFDIAIARPIQPAPILAPVLAGRHTDDGQPTRLRYGVRSGMPAMAEAALVGRLSLDEYMAGFPRHPKGLWGVACELAGRLGMSLTVAELRGRYGSTRWSLRS
jgi:hypothetical protein